MRGRFITFLFYAHIVLLLFVMPFVFAFGEILSDTVFSIAFVTIYVFNFFFFPVIIKDISRQRDSKKITDKRYEEEKEKNSEIEAELNNANELIKRYEKILSDKIKHDTMSGNKFPTLEALDLLSATYDKYARDDIASFRSKYYEDFKTNHIHLKKYYDELSNLYKLKDLKYNRIENMKQLNKFKITNQIYSKDRAVLRDSKGNNYTYDVELLTTHIHIPTEHVKGSIKECTIEIVSLLYAYFPNSNETQYLRFVQSEAKEGIIVKNTVSYNRHCEVISTHGEKYIVKL